MSGIKEAAAVVEGLEGVFLLLPLNPFLRVGDCDIVYYAVQLFLPGVLGQTISDGFGEVAASRISNIPPFLYAGSP